MCALPLKFPLGVQAEGMQRSEQHSVILNDLMYINSPQPPPPRRTSPYAFLDVTSTRRRHLFFPAVCLLESYSTTRRSLVAPEGVHSREEMGRRIFSFLTHSAHKVSQPLCKFQVSACLADTSGKNKKAFGSVGFTGT